MSAELLGMMAGLFTTASFIPQVLKIWRTKSAADISWGMATIFTVGTFLWLLYGLTLSSVSIVAANAITFLLSLTICVMKFRFTK